MSHIPQGEGGGGGRKEGLLSCVAEELMVRGGRQGKGGGVKSRVHFEGGRGEMKI